MPAVIPQRYTSEQDCQTCRDQHQEWSNKKNSRKGINNRIANHKLVFHGVPLPPAPQPPQPKKQKKQEGRWIKPVDDHNVKAQWCPKGTWFQLIPRNQPQSQAMMRDSLGDSVSIKFYFVFSFFSSFILKKLIKNLVYFI